ncbi:MAG: FAD-dependent oxidoreductase [Propionibacteriaceae bacterium]|nr:FAD-dependent oxidoreductase [Propionibacteriaceae bacterium]
MPSPTPAARPTATSYAPSWGCRPGSPAVRPGSGCPTTGCCRSPTACWASRPAWTTPTSPPRCRPRAWQDLLLDASIGAEASDLAGLVRARLGEEAYQRLVRPVASGIYSAEPEDLTTDVIIPGLRAALATTGSLTAAAAKLRSAAPPGPVVSSVVGGLFLLPRSLAQQITDRGGEVATRTIASKLVRDGSSWRITCSRTRPGPTPADPPLPDGEPWEVQTERVIVASDGRAAMDLLRPVPSLEMAQWSLPPGARVAHVVLALRHPGLDAGPRGSGLLVAARPPGSTPIGAKALTHLSIKWPWLREQTETHFLRVSYGRPGENPQPSVAQGLADASTLLGLDLAHGQVEAGFVVHWNDSLPPPTPLHRERVEAFRRRLVELPGLGVTGAWVAGNGLAAVLSQSHLEAERLS